VVTSVKIVFIFQDGRERSIEEILEDAAKDSARSSR
jgi:hypothetical protein